jgi:hypothetical protein
VIGAGHHLLGHAELEIHLASHRDVRDGAHEQPEELETRPGSLHLVDDVVVLERHGRRVLDAHARGRGGLDHDAHHAPDPERIAPDLEHAVGQAIQAVVEGRILAQVRVPQRGARADGQPRQDAIGGGGLRATPKSAAFSRK